MMSSPDRSPASPGIDPRYQVLETLGRGGMGVVYRVLDRVEGRVVALKTLNGPEREGLESDPGPGLEEIGLDEIDRSRFDREIRALSLLRHEGIVRLHDVGRMGDRTYFTMELLRGLPLTAFLPTAAPGIEEIRWILRVAVRILEALDHLHRSGFVHRDLKPSNIMVLERGEPSSGESPAAPPAAPPSREALLLDGDPRTKLLDFGLVKARDADLSPGRPAPGTPLYMAPEQMDPLARPDARSDLYSLGVILYQLLVRRLPHASVASALSRRAPAPPAALNPLCPPALSEAVLRLLEPEANRRFASASDLSRALLAILHERPAEAPAPRLLEPAFVGREGGLQAIREHCAAAVSGRGRVLLLSGGRGSGKTWLLEQSGIKAQAVLEHGLSSSHGRYSPGGALHQGLREVMRGLIFDLAREPGLEPLAAEIGPWGGTLLDLLGIEGTAGLRAFWPPGDGAAPLDLTAERFLQAGGALFRAGARRARLVLLDDLHEGDDLDVELLWRVARGIERLPLLIVATYRPEALPAIPSLERWLREAAAEGKEASTLAFHLDPFTDGEAARMARSMLSPQGEVDQALVGELLDRTGGVPRALEGALRALFLEGRVRLEAGAWRASAGPPPGWDRSPGGDPLADLSGEEREIISLGAVLGGSFEPEVLLAIRREEGLEDGGAPGGDEERVIARLHALLGKGLLAETAGGFSFSRPGFREGVEALLAPDERRSLHARAALALLSLPQEAARDRWESIAHHLEQGGLPGRALEYHLRAARRAAGLYANRRAIASFRAALRIAGPGAREEIAAELGRLHARIGQYQAALECFGPVGDPEASRSPALLEEVGRIHQRRGELGEARRCYERSLALAGGEPEAVARARCRLGGLRFEEGDLAGASEHFRASLEIAREREDPDGMAAAHSGLGLVEKRRDALEAAGMHFQEAYLSAERAANPAQAATALNNLGNIRRARGEDREAIECFRRSIELRERIGDRPGLGICLNNLSRVLARRGELVGAAKAALEALRIFEEVGDRKGILLATGNLGGFRLFLGDFPAARAAFLRARALAERLGDRRALADSLSCLGRLEGCRGEASEAERHLREGLRLIGDEGDHDLRAGLLAELAAARLELGDAEGAFDAVREGLEAAPVGGSPESRAALLDVAARIDLARGEVEGAVARAREGLSLIEGAGPRFDTALLHRQLGRAYRELGPDWVDRAEKHLGVSLRLFEDMGAGFERGATLVELGALWSALGEDGEALHYYRQAREALAPADAPRRQAGLRRLMDHLEGARS